MISPGFPEAARQNGSILLSFHKSTLHADVLYIKTHYRIQTIFLNTPQNFCSCLVGFAHIYSKSLYFCKYNGTFYDFILLLNFTLVPM